MYGGWRSVARGDAPDSRRGGLKDFKVLLRLLKYAGPYRALMSLGLVTMAVYILTVVATPWIVLMGVAKILDGDSQGLTTIVLLFFGNAVLNYLTHYIHLVSMTRVSQNLLRDVKDQLFDHLQDLSMSYYDKEASGRIMSRIQSDVFQIQEFMGQLSISIGDILILMAIVVAMLLMDVQLALLTMGILPLMFFFAYHWQSRSWPRFMLVRRAIAAVNGNLQENITGMRVIQSLNREDENHRVFRGLNQNYLDATLNATRFSATLMPMVEVLTGISMGVVIVFGGLMVMDGGMEVGVVVAFALYIQRFFEPIRNLTMNYTQMQRAMTGSAHIFELMDVEPQLVDRPNATEISSIKGEISFEDVHFRYDPNVEVLKGINLRISPGEMVAVVGATGAGKTTLASLILRLYDVTSGRITIDGYDNRDVKRTSLATQIGTVLQDPFLFSGSIKDNIRFCHQNVTDQQAIGAAKIVGAHEFISRMEQGYDSEVEERGSNLSVGQRQLISLARALAFDPRIIILDEATASVDSYTEMLIQRALREVLQHRTALVIAHRLSTVKNANRIIVMDQGRIVEEGNHDQLLDMQGVYSKLYQMNFGNNEVAQASADEGSGKASSTA